MKNLPLKTLPLLWQHYARFEMDQVHLLTSGAFESGQNLKEKQKIALLS